MDTLQEAEKLVDIYLDEGIIFVKQDRLLEKNKAKQYAKSKCYVGIDRISKAQLGFRQCYWEKIILYYEMQIKNFKVEAMKRCKQKEGKAQTKCLLKMKKNLTEALEDVKKARAKLESVKTRIKAKKGKTWKV